MPVYIPLSSMDGTVGIFIYVDGYTAPVTAYVEGDHIIVKLREGGTLGDCDEVLSRKFLWAKDKLRELKEKRETKL